MRHKIKSINCLSLRESALPLHNGTRRLSLIIAFRYLRAPRQGKTIVSERSVGGGAQTSVVGRPAACPRIPPDKHKSKRVCVCVSSARRAAGSFWPDTAPVECHAAGQLRDLKIIHTDSCRRPAAPARQVAARKKAAQLPFGSARYWRRSFDRFLSLRTCRHNGGVGCAPLGGLFACWRRRRRCGGRGTRFARQEQLAAAALCFARAAAAAGRGDSSVQCTLFPTVRAS